MSFSSDLPAASEGGPGAWLEPRQTDAQVARYGDRLRPQFFDVSAIRGILYRQRWLVAGALVVSVIMGLIVTLLATPMYQASSSVRIEPYGSYIVEGQDVERTVSSNQIYDLMSTQLGIITSRALARTVAENLDLSERIDFLGPEVFSNRPANMSDDQWRAARLNMAANKLHGSVSAEIPYNNWIIEITYRSESPEIAAEMANAYMNAFVSSDALETLENNEYAQGYLQEQIDSIRGRLRDAERAANDYARRNGLIMQPSGDEEEGGFATLTTANLANMNERVSAARAARIEAEQRWRSLENLPPDQLSEVQSSSLLQQLISERSAKQSQLTGLRQRLGEAHPEIVSLQTQIRDLDAQIAQRSDDIKSTARTAYLVARNQEQALQSELTAITGETLEEQESQVQYGVLEREADVLRDQLEVLLTRYNQVSTAANVDSGIVNPLDLAIVPSSPYAPSLVQNIALALVLGAAVAAALAILREIMDDKIRSFDEVEQKLGLPLLGHTPLIDQYDHVDEVSNHFSPLLEAYNSIRSTVEFALPRNANVLQLTSSKAGEGKSTTSLVLAELFASVGRKTLLIEADLRRPSLPSVLGIPSPDVGFLEVLTGQASMESALVKGVNADLDILPVGGKPTNPSEILASRQLREFIARYRTEYSMIIFDSPPMLGLADAAMLAKLVDGTIYVIEANGIGAGQARQTLKRLHSNGGNLIGAVLTKYKALSAGESYSYQYDYYSYSSDN